MATIPHLEDLSIGELISAVRQLRNYEVSEKVDGSNIQFGIDKKGFYTTREDKGGKRIYDVADYPLDFQYTYQRSSHIALQNLLPKLKSAGLHEGCRVEAEVLFGTLPNVVRYDGACNQIILLRMVEGYVYFRSLQHALDGAETTTQLLCPHTPDGKAIEFNLEKHNWKISTNPVTNGSAISRKTEYSDIYMELSYLERHLHKTAIENSNFSLSYQEVLEMPLNRRYGKINEYLWKDAKVEIKKCREKFMEFMNTDVYGTVKSVKESLLELLVRSQKSHFGPDTQHGGWIEGVVISGKQNARQIKLVDKETFGVVKNFLWKARLDIADKPQSVDKPRSFYGRMTIALMNTIGQPELATTNVLRALKKFGNTSAEMVVSISKGLNWKKGVKQAQEILVNSRRELNKLLNEYAKTRHSRSITLSNGKTFTYDDEVHQRTLQVFAGIFAEIDYMEQKLDSVNSAETLVFLLLHKQLERIK